MSEPKKPDLPDQETGVTVKPRARTKRPSMYKVLLLNDDADRRLPARHPARGDPRAILRPGPK
jgi:hypothetical protein